ncbi:MAG: glycosyltransferase family 2 protein [Saprospiraceae bacterium]|nr:glycosyltransferase family 2 protein [Saprospiraceae bacterium]
MKVSVIISLFNEEQGVLTFWSNMEKVLKNTADTDFEVIWVNDGSSDNTQLFIEGIKSSAVNSANNIKHILIEFSKNFGHEAAMIAGIDNASGEAIICLDSDGQHPPEKIPEMINAFKDGYEIVLMERLKRADNSFFKRLMSSFFYKIINSLSTIKFQDNSTDFFLISKQIARIFKSNFRDQNRFIRGFIQSIGFPVKLLSFEAPARLYGKSNYSYLALTKLAINAIFSFSNKPLRLSIIISILFIGFTFIFSLFSLYMYLFGNTPPSGYTTIILFLSFSFSLLFLTLTILSLYFEKTIQEMRKRPIYIIKKKSCE